MELNAASAGKKFEINTKGGKLLVNTDDELVVIQKEATTTPSDQPLQIVRIEAEDPRNVSDFNSDWIDI